MQDVRQDVLHAIQIFNVFAKNTWALGGYVGSDYNINKDCINASLLNTVTVDGDRDSNDVTVCNGDSWFDEGGISDDDGTKEQPECSAGSDEEDASDSDIKSAVLELLKEVVATSDEDNEGDQAESEEEEWTVTGDTTKGKERNSSVDDEESNSENDTKDLRGVVKESGANEGKIADDRLEKYSDAVDIDSKEADEDEMLCETQEDNDMLCNEIITLSKQAFERHSIEEDIERGNAKDSIQSTEDVEMEDVESNYSILRKISSLIEDVQGASCPISTPDNDMYETTFDKIVINTHVTKVIERRNCAKGKAFDCTRHISASRECDPVTVDGGTLVSSEYAKHMWKHKAMTKHRRLCKQGVKRKSLKLRGHTMVSESTFPLCEVGAGLDCIPIPLRDYHTSRALSDISSVVRNIKQVNQVRVLLFTLYI